MFEINLKLMNRIMWVIVKFFKNLRTKKYKLVLKNQLVVDNL